MGSVLNIRRKSFGALCVVMFGFFTSGWIPSKSSAQIQAQCVPYVQPQLVTGVGPKVRARLDLECDGEPDTVFIGSGIDHDGYSAVTVRVSGGGTNRSLAVAYDGALTEISDAGDLNGDGIVDLVLVHMDESGNIWPTIIIVARDSLILPQITHTMGIYYWDEFESPECKAEDLLPTIERDEEGVLVVSWMKTPSPENWPPPPPTDCESPPRQLWEFVNGTIRLRGSS